MEEREAQCLLGNGGCPTNCRLYEMAAEITAMLGDRFNPVESRRTILFADAFDYDVNVIQVQAVIAKCVNEPKVREQS